MTVMSDRRAALEGARIFGESIGYPGQSCRIERRIAGGVGPSSRRGAVSC